MKHNLVILALLMSPKAYCASITQNLNVSLDIVSSCSLSVEPLDFGVHIIGDTNISAQTNATVTCVNGVPYILSTEAINVHTYELVNSLGESGMNSIPYSLYRDSAGTQVLATDDPTALDVSFSSTIGTGLPQIYPIYGKLDDIRLGTVSAGTYTDTVTLQLTY